MARFRILISGVLLPAPFRKVVGYVWRKNNVRSRRRLVGFVERGSRGGTERIDVGYREGMCWTGAGSLFAQQRYAPGVCLSSRAQEKLGMLGGGNFATAGPLFASQSLIILRFFPFTAPVHPWVFFSESSSPAYRHNICHGGGTFSSVLFSPRFRSSWPGFRFLRIWKSTLRTRLKWTGLA